MAERTRSEQRKRRSESRERRRSLAAKPFEELDEAAGAEQSDGAARRALKQAATTALAGAFAAGVAGAAKALADRRDDQPEPDDAEGLAEEAEPQAAVTPDEDESAPEREADEEEDDRPQAAADADEEEDEQPQAAAQAEAQDEPEEPKERQREENQGGEAADGSLVARGASPDEVKEIVDEAKRELQELLGKEAERVSGFHRYEGRWTVMLEVVDVRRIPDTTDVLSSYEVAFDEDRNLVSLSETRRYRRSQVEE